MPIEEEISGKHSGKGDNIIASVGIDYAQVTRQLQEEGVQKLLDSFHTLFACIEAKRQTLLA